MDSVLFDNQTNTLTIYLQNGGSKTVDLSYLNNAGTDEQDLYISGDSLMIDNGDGVDISQLNSDGQEITLSGDTLSIERLKTM